MKKTNVNLMNASQSSKSLAFFMRTTALTAAGLVAMSASAHADDYALPVNGQVVQGSTVINPVVVPGVLNINQNSDRTVINWDSFNIGEKATVQFYQPNSGSLAVNRVVGLGSDPTKILGTLRANGNVMVLDRNGVLFGKNSVVDVGGLVVSTGNVDDLAVMNGGSQVLLNNVATGEIITEGTITVADSGLASFVAPSVKNSGVINAKLGRVALAAGMGAATVDLYGDGLVEFAPAGTAGQVLSENSGTINAEGGLVKLSASAAKAVVDQTVNMTGVVNASSASIVGGKIVLSAKKVQITNTAKLKADKTTVTAETVDLDATITGQVTGAANVVNVKSNNAKINQGLDIISENGKVNVGAGTYDEDVVISKAGVTLKGNRGGVSGGDASRGSNETIITPHSPGVVVTANNVVVDGVVIDGASNGIEVLGASGVTLKNNIINHSSNHAIYTSGAAYVNISNNKIDNTGNDAVYSFNSLKAFIAGNLIGTVGTDNNINGNGILLDQSHSAQVKGNTITETTSTAAEIGSGVHVLDSNNVLVSKNTISNAEWDGIKVTRGKSIVAESNDIDNVVRVGVYSNRTGGMTVRNNDIDKADLYGVRVLSTTGVVIEGNLIDTVGLDGISIENSGAAIARNNTIGYGADGVLGTKDDTATLRDGISILNSPTASVTGNLVAHTGNNGVYATYSNGSLFEANSINYTGKSGVYVYNNANIRILANNIGTTGANNNINGDGVLAENIDGLTVSGNTISETTSTAAEIGSGVHVINGINAYVTNNTISNAEWDGVKVTAGNNVSVTGNDIDNVVRVGVYANLTKSLSIKNNDIDGADLYGVRILSSSSAIIEGNEVDAIGIDGISVKNSANVSIKDNVVGYGADGVLGTEDDSKIVQDGISAVNAAGVSILNNLVAHTGRNGVFVDPSPNALVQGNTINFTGKSGVYVYDSANVRILSNNIGTFGTNNNINGDGVLVEKSDGVTVANNTITETTSTAADIGSGVHILNSNGANVHHNTISNAEWDGVKVTNGATETVSFNDIDNVVRVGVYASGTKDLTVNNNDINGAGLYGVRVLKLAGNTLIDGNVINAIGLDGVSSVNTANVQAKNNTIGYGADGIVGTADDTLIGRDGVSMVNAANSVVQGNLIAHTGRNGVFVDPSPNTVVASNTVDFVGNNGIYVVSSNDSNVYGNTVGVNGAIGANGIKIYQSNNASVSGNTVQNSGQNGISLYQIAGNMNVVDNVVSQSGQNGIVVDLSNGYINIDGNDVSSSGWNGILVQGSYGYANDTGSDETFAVKSLIAEIPTIGYGVNIVNNDVRSSGHNGIKLYNVGGSALIDGNDVSGSSWNGMDVSSYVYGQHEGSSPNYYGSGLYDLQITNNDVSRSNWDGIHVHSGASTINISSNNVSASGSDGIEVTGETGGYYGDMEVRMIYPYPSSNFQTVSVNNNIVRDSGDDGIYLSSITGSVTVDANDIAESGYNGIDLGNVNSTAYKGYYSGDSADFAMFAAPAYTVDITNNVIDASAENGIELYNVGNYVNVAKNMITNSSNNGIYAYNSSFIDGPVFAQFAMTEGYYGGYYGNTPIDLHIVGNTIQNSDVVITDNDNDTFVSEGYFGNYDGKGNAGIQLNIGSEGVAEVSGNTVAQNFSYGLLAYSGLIDLTGETNTIRSTDIGMGFYANGGVKMIEALDVAEEVPPYDYLANVLRLVDNTIGTTAFEDQSKLFVDLGLGTFFAPGSPTIMNGNNATYTLGGVTIAPTPAGFVTADELVTLENMFNHYNDSPNRGLFFFQAFADQGFDQKDVFRQFGLALPQNGGGSLRITGLPLIAGNTGGAGAANLNNIAPQAGGTPNNLNDITPAAGEESSQETAANQAGDIEPSAGGNGSDNSACWADANQSLGEGKPVQFNYGGNANQLLRDAADCGNGQAI